MNQTTSRFITSCALLGGALLSSLLLSGVARGDEPLFLGPPPSSTLQTVALTGQQAPGMAAGVTYAQLLSGNSSNKPSINNNGQIAYWGRVTGSGITPGVNNHGIWRRDSTSSTLAYASSSFYANPLMPNAGIGTDTVQNSSNQIGFEAGSSGAINFWVERPSGLTASALSGIAPGTSANFNNLEKAFLSDNGTLLLLASLNTSQTTVNDDRGIWINQGSSLQLLVREGDAAPGTPAGVNYADFDNSSPVLNQLGQMVFRSKLAGVGITSANNTGIWTNRSGSMQLVARQANPAPGTPAGTNFGIIGSDVEHVAINSAAHLAFRADLTGTGVTTANNNGIWTDRSGTLTLYKRAGEAAPGTPAGVNFSFFRAPVLNNNDKIAFFARLSNASSDKNTGIWSDASGTLTALALEGSPAPGTAPGVVYGDFEGFYQFVLNNSGQMAFTGLLAGTGVNSSNDDAIWAQDRLGNIQLIARTGSQLEVAPGDFRTITANGLRFAGGSGNDDSMPSGFNDSGVVAFYATFTDGSAGIFYSTVAAVPEPSTYALLGMLGIAGVLLKRRVAGRTGKLK